MPFEGPSEDDKTKFDWVRVHDEWTCGCLVQPKGTRAKKDRVPKVTLRAGLIRTVWVDAENCYDSAWSKRLGIDNDLMFVVVPEYAQQAGDIVEAFLRSGEIDVVVIDSIAELTPAEEIEASTEEWQMGLHARVMNKAIRRWGAALNALGADATMKPVVLLVNQTRDSITRGEVTPGGWQQYFKSSIDVRIGAAKYQFKEYKQGKQKIEELLFADVSGLVRKNKTHVPMKRFSFRFYLSNIDGFETGSTNEIGVILKRSLEWGVIEKKMKGKQVVGYSFKWGEWDDEWKTQKAIVEDMQANELFFWAVRDRTLDVVVKAAKGEEY